MSNTDTSVVTPLLSTSTIISNVRNISLLRDSLRSSQFWEKYALIMIGIYPFGIPLLYGILLYRKRKILLDGEQRLEDARVQGISFLWKMYEPSCWWFEVFECMRRLSLTGLIIFVYPDSPTQTVVAMLLAIISIKIYAWQQPFVDDSDDFLAEVTQYSIFFTLLSALIIKVDVTKDEGYSQDLMGVAMVAMNLAAIVLAAVGILYQPIMDLVAMCVKRHRWHTAKTCENWDEHACDEHNRPPEVTECHHFLFLPSISTNNETKTYFTKFCRTDATDAGWEKPPQWTGRTPLERDLVEESPYGVNAEWRCSTGNGPYDQARISLKLDIPFDKMRRWVINERDQLLAKELHHHCLKHLSDREKIVYKKYKVRRRYTGTSIFLVVDVVRASGVLIPANPFRFAPPLQAFRICDDRDAVLHVTNFQEHNDNGQRQFTQLCRSVGHRELTEEQRKSRKEEKMGRELFSPKSSYILGRKRTTVLFEGYEITELDEFSVEIVYGIEIDSLGGFLDSPAFTRLYYYRLFENRVGDLLFFDEAPDAWLEGKHTKKARYGARSEAAKPATAQGAKERSTANTALLDASTVLTSQTLPPHLSQPHLENSTHYDTTLTGDSRGFGGRAL